MDQGLAVEIVESGRWLFLFFIGQLGGVAQLKVVLSAIEAFLFFFLSRFCALCFLFFCDD